VARAKDYILAANESGTDVLALRWLREQGADVPKSIDIDAAGATDECARIGHGLGLRLAFYQAVWELVSVGELLPAGSGSFLAGLAWRNERGSSGLPLGHINCVFPATIRRPPLPPSSPSPDFDLLFKGAPPAKLHPGVQEAVRQSLACFRRGLYLPAIVMLAAGAEAAWIECALALGARLKDKALQTAPSDPLTGFGKIVALVRKATQQPAGKAIVVGAGTTLARLADAELWTTTLRERRNAVHWGKAQSFIAQHSEAGTLLLAAPQHLDTLERIRLAC
jgi:hypothetical protein